MRRSKRRLYRAQLVSGSALIAALVLQGCSSADAHTAIMPDVVEATLELARSDLERAGLGEDEEIEIIGGGMFGIIDESNWTVCEQVPDAGEPLVRPRLTVDRDCGADDSDPQESVTPERPEDHAPDSASPQPIPTASASVTPTKAPSPQPSSTPKTQESTSPTPKSSKKSPGIDAKAIEKAFLKSLENNFVESIGSMCDASYTHWACFYDGVASGPTYLRINLTTDGGWSSAALKDMADQTGRHWFNFVGCDFPELSTIVVNINGVDHNVFRSGMNLSC